MSTAIIERIKPLIPAKSQRHLGQARLRVRTLTSGLRILPDFLIIGAQRCGTGSLYKYLAQHPHVLPPLHKEVQFFSRKFHLGVGWYRAHFPLEVHRDYAERVQRGRVLTFEATPNYLFHPYAAVRAREVIPDAKLVVLLRNPVDRAISHYRLSILLSVESLPFDQAVQAERGRLARDLEAMNTEPSYDPRDFLNFSYVARGIYVDQLKVWMDHFPRERLLVLKSEQMFEEPGHVYREVLRFLDLPLWEPSQFRAFGTRTRVPSAAATSPLISEDDQQMLLDLFRPHNERLYELIGRDFGWDR